ncbi:alpha/beta fold hydrolase [Chachezhania sediminis]|uniref:alpha/beta fold hydrolase n=1 Tax=Chachezhania sediminis TaxID=2599291 RepID=UPI00131CB5CC|nr:alpha/beta hydrolase [Chachezhania sediminis]
MRLAVKILLALAACLIAFWAFVLWRAGEREARAEAAFPPQGQLIEVDGNTIHALVMGEGPDVVLIHGSGGNLRDMTFRLAPALADRYRVIVLDRPGFGYSPRMPGRESIADQANILSQAAQALEADKPVVLGHSYGGAVALAWAVRHPDRLSALVPVASPSQTWDEPLDPLYQVTSSGIGQVVAVPLLTAFVPDTTVADALLSIFAPEEPPEEYAAHVGPGLTLRRASMAANGVQRATLRDEIAALVPRYGQIAVPTEIVHGTADTTVGLERHAVPLARAVDGANLTPVQGAGHMPHHTATDRIAAAVDRAARRADLREAD